MKPHRGWVRGAMAFIVLLLVATACGVPRDGSPQTIPNSRLPDDLIEGQRPTVEAAPDATNIQIWMVGEGDLLTTVARDIPATPESVMQSLLLGTGTDERAAGITTAITRETSGTVAVQQERIAFVDLAEGSLRSTPSEQKLAYGQFIYSLTGLQSVESVVFSIAGESVSVLTDGGASNPGQALTRRDFESLNRTQVNFGADDDDDTSPTPAPLPPPPTTTAPDDRNRTDVWIWMIDEDQMLIRVLRRLELLEETILASLLLGPDIPERNVGITSAIPDDALDINVDVDETTGTALVDLAVGSLPDLADDARLRAVAQIVYSLTGLARIDQVIISLGGQREAMPTDNGIAEPGVALTRADFASLAPDLFAVPSPDDGTEPENESGADPDGGTAPPPAATFTPEPTAGPA